MLNNPGYGVEFVAGHLSFTVYRMILDVVVPYI